MSFLTRCSDIETERGVFQNGANLPAIQQAGVLSDRKQGQVSMHRFETPTSVYL
jgi:hypothetical protein